VALQKVPKALYASSLTERLVSMPHTEQT